MRIKEVTKSTVFYVKTGGNEPRQYTRYSSDNWSVLMGESEEPVYECQELEEEFQRYIAKKK